MSESQFPSNKNTPVMTVPAILDWLEGEADTIRELASTATDPLLRYMHHGQVDAIEILIEQLTETSMRALDGDESAGRRPPQA